MIKVYFNPECSKCQSAKEFLEKNKKEFELVNYLDKKLTSEEINEILQKGNLKVEDILRKDEEEYKQFIEGKNLSSEQTIEEIIKHPRVLQRPIMVSDKNASVTRDSESLENFIKASYEDFAKLDLRVGKIIKVEDHPNADKLYVLTVDLGEETPRTIVAGLKSRYQKEELENKKAVFVANLAPAKLRGVESNGMILAAASSDDSEVYFLTPEKDIKEGSKIR